MEVSPQAQREFRQSWGDHLLATFNPDLFEPPHVSKRNARYYIMDGQHRVYAFRHWIGDDDDQEVQCWTYEGLTLEDEARLFLYLSRNRKAISSFEDFQIALTAEEEVETDILRLLRANAEGLQLARDRNVGVAATGTLKTTYRTTDQASFGGMIRIVNGAYGVPGFESPVIRGIGAFVHRYNGGIDEDRAIDKLGNLRGGVKGFIGQAQQTRERMGCSLYAAVAATAVDAYNRGAKAKEKLPGWWKA